MPLEHPSEMELMLLRDMLDSARLAIEHLGDTCADDLASDIYMQDAVVRRITIIGEAARQIPPQRRSALVDLPWGDIVGMRSVLVHDYREVDYSALWKTVRNALPDLLRQLESFFDREVDNEPH